MLKNILSFLFAACFSFNTFSQCEYNLDNIVHVQCYGQNTGEIDISISNSNATFWWQGPNNFTSQSSSLSNLFAGEYILTIMVNSIPGDTSSLLICKIEEVITVQQTIEIGADFTLSNLCDENDSADVTTLIWGGTPPYTTLWNTGDTSRNTTNLAQSQIFYSITITDANGCTNNQFLLVEPITTPIQTFMASGGIECKDDNTGFADVYVSNGQPPFIFEWESQLEINHDTVNSGILINDNQSSKIHRLSPGYYRVTVVDDYGCQILDSIEVKSDPDVCLKVYKVFSPNGDEYHEYWEIKNIHLYPKALVEVYSRNGTKVFRRRNYTNTIDYGFKGVDQNGNILPSGTYYYVIDLANEDKVFKGTLTIIR
tara:strand:- start:1572 stop:2681 length:1110 start_codon:yes stop_codon:yes gene_type:complete